MLGKVLFAERSTIISHEVVFVNTFFENFSSNFSIVKKTVFMQKKSLDRARIHKLLLQL